MFFVAFCCSFSVFGVCFHLPFVAVCCSLLLFLAFEILSQKPKRANAFCSSLRLFVARLDFLWMFPFEHSIARCGFLFGRKNQNEQQKAKKVQMEARLKLSTHCCFSTMYQIFLIQMSF